MGPEELKEVNLSRLKRQNYTNGHPLLNQILPYHLGCGRPESSIYIDVSLPLCLLSTLSTIEMIVDRSFFIMATSCTTDQRKLIKTEIIYKHLGCT